MRTALPGVLRRALDAASSVAAPAVLATFSLTAALLATGARADAAAEAPAATATAQATPAVTPAAALSAEEDVESKESKFPLHANLTLSNAVGNGLLQAGGQYQQRPSWGSGLDTGLSVSVPTFDVLPKLSLSGRVGFSLSNWLPSYNSEGYDRIVRVSDFSLGLRAPDLYKEEFTNISISPSLGVSLPLSLGSRQQNKLAGISGGVGVGWGSPETPVGKFNVSYGLRGGVNLYTQNAASIPCDASVNVANTATNPVDSLYDDAPVFYGREAEILDNGECRLRGRQTIGSVSNSLGASWSPAEAHSVSLSLGWSHRFVRPLANAPELHSPNASDQNFSESTSGGLEYSYTLPFDFNASLSAGLSSEQSTFTADGRNLRFPFWDFVTPGNNFSAAYLNLTVGI